MDVAEYEGYQAIEIAKQQNPNGYLIRLEDLVHAIDTEVVRAIGTNLVAPEVEETVDFITDHASYSILGPNAVIAEGSVVAFSYLAGCSISSAIVERSTVVDSEVNESRIADSDLNSVIVHRSVVTQSTIVEGSEIVGSEVVDCQTIRISDVKNSTIIDSTLANSTVIDSSVLSSSEVKDSAIRDHSSVTESKVLEGSEVSGRSSVAFHSVVTSGKVEDESKLTTTHLERSQIERATFSDSFLADQSIGIKGKTVSLRYAELRNNNSHFKHLGGLTVANDIYVYRKSEDKFSIHTSQGEFSSASEFYGSVIQSINNQFGGAKRRRMKRLLSSVAEYIDATVANWQ